MSITEITVTDLRRQVGPLTDRIKGGESFRVTSHQRPLMMLLPWSRADDLLASEVRLQEAVEMAGSLSDRVRAAVALHVPHPEDGECAVCMEPMPCATLKALRGSAG